MIRVLLVDDQKLVRESWHALISRSFGISVVGEARDGKEAVQLASQLRPDVVLMDVRMPRLDGLRATQQIVQQQSGAKVLLVTIAHEEELVRAAMQHGARGYVSKNDMFDELIPAILDVQTQQLYFSKTIREQYPHLLEERLPRAAVGTHVWYDPTWVSLNKRLELTRAEAYVIIDRARVMCRESATLRAQTHNAREFALQLFRLRHPDALAVTWRAAESPDGQPG